VGLLGFEPRTSRLWVRRSTP